MKLLQMINIIFILCDFMKTITLKDNRDDMGELYNPYFWENGEIIASVLLEPYWLEKAREESANDGIDFDLLEFAEIHNAHVVLRITTPKERKEIAFPFIKFISVYTKPEEALEIFERTVKNYLKSIGYINIEIKHGKREKLIRNKLIRNYMITGE